MHIALPIPDDLAERLGTAEDLSRRALEAFGVEEFRARRLTGPELMRVLGLEIPYQLDSVLKRHGVFHDYGVDDLDAELEAVKRLGI